MSVDQRSATIACRAKTQRNPRQGFSWLGGLLGFLLWFGIAYGRTPSTGFILEIEAANTEGGAAQLFYDIGQWYSVHDSSRVTMPASTTLAVYRFPIPAKPIKRLRLDPAEGAATVQIGKIRLLTNEGVGLASFGPEHLQPMHAITHLQVANGVARIQTAAGDPMLLIARPLHAETVRALDRSIVGRSEVLALGVLVAGLAAMGVCFAVRGVASGGLGTDAVGRARRRAWIFSGVFLTVLGARLYWLKHYSRPMPFWDDWKTGAIDLIIPLRGGFLDWEALFIPHGEHRILVTRLVTLVGSIINGEWDPRVGMAAGAVLFAGAVALVGAAASQAGRRGLALTIPLVAWCCLPFDVRNIFWGDQSQMYAVFFFAVCTVAIATTERISRGACFGAAAAGLVSLFTMGSGFVAPAMAVVICVARWRAEVEQRRALAGLAAIFALLTILGLSLYRKAPFQGSGYAQTWAQFWPAFVGRAAWPLPPHVASAVVVWLPWLLVVACAVWERRASRLEWLGIGLGGWTLANVIGLAHGRSLESPPFDSKYYTVMAVAVMSSLLCSAGLIARWPGRRPAAILGVAASLTVTAVMFPLGIAGIRGAKDQFAERSANDNLVRPFLATGDPTQLRSTPWHQLPYWNGTELADILDSRLLQPWLPAALRASLAQRVAPPVSGAQSPGPVTIAVRSLMKAGAALFFAGCALLIWCAARDRSAQSRRPAAAEPARA